VGATSYTYVANGNMTGRGSDNITWDAENRPVSIATASGNSTFVYDGDGRRVMKIEGGETILYINKYFEVNLTTSENTSYYYLGNRLVAMKKGDDLRYIHQDHLTGTALVTDASGNVTGTMKYYPYGYCRNSTGDLGTDKLFTGQRLDDTGLYYYGARYYDPTIGRFISPDTFIQWVTGFNAVSHPLTVNTIPLVLGSIGTPQSVYPIPVPLPIIDPQTLNRYSYVINNPLRYVDTTGECGLGPVIGVAIALIVGWVSYHIDMWGEDPGDWPQWFGPNAPPEPTPPTPKSDLLVETEPTSYASDRVTPPTPSGLMPDIDFEWWKPDPQPELHAKPESDSPTSSNTDQKSESDSGIPDDIFDTYEWQRWDQEWGVLFD